MSLRTRERISSTLKIDLNKDLKSLADKTRIPISKLLDEAVEDLLKKHDTETTE